MNKSKNKNESKDANEEHIKVNGVNENTLKQMK